MNVTAPPAGKIMATMTMSTATTTGTMRVTTMRTLMDMRTLIRTA
jgi:hypothetical protein